MGSIRRNRSKLDLRFGVAFAIWVGAAIVFGIFWHLLPVYGRVLGTVLLILTTGGIGDIWKAKERQAEE